jgi:glycosyltransferase involved in cell wall biosynthesis
MNSLFTIIIPTYNRAELIKETIDSIRCQTYENWECIVVDDGSKDNTKVVVKTLNKEDARIRYIYQENAERSAARNNGIRNAIGEYICFLDSDDVFDPYYLEKLNNFINTQNDKKCMIVSNFKSWDGVQSKQVETPDLSEPISDWLFQYPVSPSRVCAHHSIFQDFQFSEDICIVEDTVLWVSISTKFQITQLKEHLILYREHEFNSVVANSGSCFKRYDGLKLFFGQILSNSVSSSMKKKMLSETEFRIAEYYQFHNKKFKAAKYGFKSLFTQWNHEQRKMRILFLLESVPGFSVIRKKAKTKA